MAILHITTEQAASNIENWIARARLGDEVIIEDASGPPVVLQMTTPPGRTISQILAILESRNSSAVLDGDFENDLLDIQKNSKPFHNQWE